MATCDECEEDPVCDGVTAGREAGTGTRLDPLNDVIDGYVRAARTAALEAAAKLVEDEPLSDRWRARSNYRIALRDAIRALAGAPSSGTGSADGQ